MNVLKSRILLDNLVFPECPRWKDDKLWFSNIFADQVISMNVDGIVDEKLDIPSIGISWISDNTLLFVEHRYEKQRLMQYKNGEISVYSDELNTLSPFMYNDLVVSYNGFAYTGNIGHSADNSKAWEQLAPAHLAIVKPDGTAEIASTDLYTPNGMVITPDNKKLIVAETRVNRLTSFDIAEDGSLNNRKTFAQLEEKHRPDGICIDAEGAVWIAGVTECIRVKEGGEITHIVKTEGKMALACMLGGEDRKTLFICTKDLHINDRKTFGQTRSGKIEAIRVHTAGVGRP